MEANGITPRFEFGFGLSYTTFGYSNLTITDFGSSKVVSFKLTNTGSFSGTEIPQLYLGYPTSAGEPPKVLRGFEEVILTSGATSTVQMKLSQRDLR
jgi:beta-glucosidase